MVVNACSGLDMEPGMNYNCHICFIGEDAGKEPGLGFLNRMICGWRHMIVWQKSYWRRRWLRLYRSHMVKKWKGRGNGGQARVFRPGQRRRKKLTIRTRERKKRIMRKILIAAAGLAAYGAVSGQGGFFTGLREMVQIRYVEEQEAAPVDRTGNLRTEPAADGGWQQREAPLEGRLRKEGVTIILDKGSVSIFRMEEHMETGSD